MKKFLFVALLAMIVVAGSADAAYVGVLTKNLKQGMTDAEVTLLQQGLAQDAIVYPAGLVTGYFGPLTKAAVIKFQEKFASEVLAPVGLTSGSGYVGPMTRAKFNALYGVVSPTPTPTPTATPTPTPGTGVEGSVTVTMYGVPSDGTQVKAGTADVAISAFDSKAVSSNMALQRIYVNFGLRPWLYFSDISLWDGAQLIARKTLSSSVVEELTAGSDYRVSFDALNIVVNKDTTKTLTVKVSAFGSPVNGTWPSSGETVTIKANAVRAVDGLGINQYGPASNLSARTFDAMVATNASIEALSNSNTPAERIVQISSTTVTSSVDALVLDLKSKDSNATLKTLIVSLATDATNVDDLITAVKLYQGGTLLTSTALGSGVGNTEDVTLSLSSPYVALTKDARTTFTVKFDFKAVVTANQGKYLTATLTGNTTNVVAEDTVTYATPAVSGTVAGKKQFAYPEYPTVLLASIPSPVMDANTSTLATVSFTVNVTAVGADVYVAKATNMVATSSAGVAVSQSVASAPDTADSTDNYIVRSGVTRAFTVSVVMNNKGGASAGFKKAWLKTFKWAKSDITTYTTFTDMLGFGTDAAIGTSFYSNEIYMLN